MLLTCLLSDQTRHEVLDGACKYHIQHQELLIQSYGLLGGSPAKAEGYEFHLAKRLGLTVAFTWL